MQWPEKQPTPRGPKQHPPDRLYTDFSKQKLDNTVAGGEGKKYLQDSVKCVLHIRREVKLDTFVNSAFHFTKGLVSRNAT
jgi:hypothetical protein